MINKLNLELRKNLKDKLAKKSRPLFVDGFPHTHLLQKYFQI